MQICSNGRVSEAHASLSTIQLPKLIKIPTKKKRRRRRRRRGASPKSTAFIRPVGVYDVFTSSHAFKLASFIKGAVLSDALMSGCPEATGSGRRSATPIRPIETSADIGRSEGDGEPLRRHGNRAKHQEVPTRLAEKQQARIRPRILQTPTRRTCTAWPPPCTACPGPLRWRGSSGSTPAAASPAPAPASPPFSRPCR